MRCIFSRRILLACAGLAVLGLTAFAGATTYPGNGDTSFGGPIGLASLALTDNGSVICTRPVLPTRAPNHGSRDATAPAAAGQRTVLKS